MSLGATRVQGWTKSIISDFLAGSGRFASASREMAEIAGLIWFNPEG